MKRHRSVIKIQCLEKPWQAENVITMEMREKNGRNIEPSRETHHLSLCPLANVEEKPLTFSAKQYSTRIPFCCWNCPARPEEGDFQTHADITVRGVKRESCKQESRPASIIVRHFVV
jgi:hypothetical protein